MPHLDSTLENIFNGNQRSVHLMVNPRLSEVFFWHFHPEIELVYIEGASGTRHVGSHVSRYTDADLVLIGSNIPHLNFDYGVRTDYEKRVLHFRSDFLLSLKQPELEELRNLLDEASYGLAFGKETISQLRDELLDLSEFSDFELFLRSLKILKNLCAAQDKKRLHSLPVAKTHTDRDHGRLKEVYAYVERNFQGPIDNQTIADHVHISKEAFCRYFKKITKITFTEFVNQYRVNNAKKLLMHGASISEACYSSGFNSPSYFNRVFKKLTSEKPGTFRRKFEAEI